MVLLPLLLCFVMTFDLTQFYHLLRRMRRRPEKSTLIAYES